MSSTKGGTTLFKIFRCWGGRKNVNDNMDLYEMDKGDDDAETCPTYRIEDSCNKVDANRTEVNKKINIDNRIDFIKKLYKQLIIVLKSNPYYLIKVFVFELDLSEEEIDSVRNNIINSDETLLKGPSSNEVGRIYNIIDLINKLRNSSASDVLNFTNSINIRKSAMYGGNNFLQSITHPCNQNIPSFQNFFRTYYGKENINDCINMFIYVPLYYNSISNKVSFFTQYFQSLFFYGLDILLAKYEKELYDLGISKNSQTDENNKKIILGKIGYDLDLLKRSINDSYKDVYDNVKIGSKIDKKIDDSQKRLKQMIFNHYLINTNTIEGVNVDEKELYGNSDLCNQPYIYDRLDDEYKKYWELQLSSFQYDKNETPISKIGDLEKCEDVRKEIDKLLGTNPVKYGKVKSKKKRAKKSRMRKSMTRQTRRLARSKKKLSLAKRRSSIFYTST